MQARLSISPWKASPNRKSWSCSTVAKWWPPTPSRQRDGGVPPLANSPRLYAFFGPGAPALPGKAWVKSWQSAKEAPPSGELFLCIRLVVCQTAKRAPLCKGSCRRTPTEGLTASRRTQAVLPHPTIENQLNHSLGFAIPPDMAAAPRRHKGGFSLPGRIQPTGAKKNWERRHSASPLQKLEKVA